MLLSKSCAILSLSLFVLAVMVTPAYSTTITTYSDSASWLAATSGVQTDNFEGLAPAGTYTLYDSGVFQNGVEFLGIAGTNTHTGVMDTTMFSWDNFGTHDAGFFFQTTGGTITLPTPVTAFSVNLFTNPAAATYTVSTLSTPFTVPTFAAPNPAFFGVTSDTAFTTVSLQVPAGTMYAFFDNFQWGTAQVTTQAPEAGSFLLIGSGLLGLAVFRRRRQLR